jgi:hypothetical protein
MMSRICPLTVELASGVKVLAVYVAAGAWRLARVAAHG